MAEMKNAIVVNQNISQEEKEQKLKEMLAQNYDEREYLVLMVTFDDKGEEHKEWEIKIGRENTFMYLKGMIEAGAIQMESSKLLTAKTNFEEALTVYGFMRYCMEKEFDFCRDLEFDLDDYIK